MMHRRFVPPKLFINLQCTLQGWRHNFSDHTVTSNICLSYRACLHRSTWPISYLYGDAIDGLDQSRGDVISLSEFSCCPACSLRLPLQCRAWPLRFINGSSVQCSDSAFRSMQLLAALFARGCRSAWIKSRPRSAGWLALSSDSVSAHR